MWAETGGPGSHAAGEAALLASPLSAALSGHTGQQAGLERMLHAALRKAGQERKERRADCW